LLSLAGFKLVKIFLQRRPFPILISRRVDGRSPFWRPWTQPSSTAWTFWHIMAENLSTKTLMNSTPRPTQTVYLDRSIDDFLTWESRATGRAKNELFERHLREGIQKAQAEPATFGALVLRAEVLVLRSFAMHPEMDRAIRVAAFDGRMLHNEALRRFLALSLRERSQAWLCAQELEQAAGSGAPSKPVRM
jgi:hypothetical protein